MTRTPTARPTVAIALLVGVDLTTKWWSTRTLDAGPITTPGPINLQLSYNTGTAFGLFADLPAAITSLLITAVLVIFIITWHRQHTPTAPTVLILAGGIANLIDRLQGNGVVDMLHTGWWPTFNIADTYITVGVALWAIDHVRTAQALTESRNPPLDSATAAHTSSADGS